MPAGPSRIAEAIVAILIPPASREEVTGDLHERYRSPLQYAMDALCTVPLVILSRIRRTADPQVLVVEALGLYGSFLGAARLTDRALLLQPMALLRLAIPVVVFLLGMVMEDVYARPGLRSAIGVMRGPVLGMALAWASQSIGSELAIPRATMLWGSVMGLVLCSGIRVWLPPPTSQLHGVNAPAHWLKRDAAVGVSLETAIRICQVVFVVLLVAGLVGLIPEWQPRQRRSSFGAGAIVVFVATYSIWRRR